MLSEFISKENPTWSLKIQNYQPPEHSDIVRYPAMINDDQFVVMQMSSVDSSVGDNLDMMTLCTGSLETEILPLLTSSVFATEVCIMFYIEKFGDHILYRSRNCSLLLPKMSKLDRCQNCQDLVDNLTQLHQQNTIHEENNIKEETFMDSDHWVEDFEDEKYEISDVEEKSEVKHEEKPSTVISFSMTECNNKEKVRKKPKKKKKLLKPRQCPYCKENFRSETRRWNHVSEEHPEKLDEYNQRPNTFICPAEGCGERYVFHKTLIKHALHSHNVTIEPFEKKIQANINESVSCHLCGKVLQNKYTLNDHLRRHEDGQRLKEVKCPSEGCDKTFTDRKELNKHVRNFHNDNCPFCGEEFGRFGRSGKDSSKLVTHLEIYHINEKESPLYMQLMAKHQKTYVCQDCGKFFHNKQFFNNHMREVHPNSLSSTERCHICGKSYKKGTLKVHLQRHEKCDSLCIECGKTLPNKISLETHIRNNHRKEPVRCPECPTPRFFPTKSELAKHVRKIHLALKLYPCDMCDKHFANNQRLVQHKTAIHYKLKPFLCEFCNFECARKCNLNLHRRKSHNATENMTKAKLIKMAESGEHPYYNKEKLQMLLVAQ